MKRKGLNDVLSNDRSIARAAQGRGADPKAKDNLFDFNSGKLTGGGGYKRCYQGHPAMPLPGTEFVVYGGSCSEPVVHDADIYVGLDHSVSLGQMLLPWSTQQLIFFKIQDMGVPKSAGDFKKLITWLHDQVTDGKKVHVGCIGGHGRTGMVLAALVSTFGEPDAIAYVRKHYCTKAVESSAQVDFLAKNFGIKPLQSSKVSSSSVSQGWGDTGKKRSMEYHPMAHVPNIWTQRA